MCSESDGEAENSVHCNESDAQATCSRGDDGDLGDGDNGHHGDHEELSRLCEMQPPEVECHIAVPDEPEPGLEPEVRLLQLESKPLLVAPPQVTLLLLK